MMRVQKPVSIPQDHGFPSDWLGELGVRFNLPESSLVEDPVRRGEARNQSNRFPGLSMSGLSDRFNPMHLVKTAYEAMDDNNDAGAARTVIPIPR